MASNRAAMRLNATHGNGSSGTNVLCTIPGGLLCWASIGPDISKTATEIRNALILGLLQRDFGFTGQVRRLLKLYRNRRVQNVVNDSHNRTHTALHGLPIVPPDSCSYVRLRECTWRKTGFVCRAICG